MKKPEEYLKYMSLENDIIDLYLESKSDFIKAIKQAQKDAYNQALEDAAENAVAKDDPSDCGTGEIWVDEQSILKLKIK